MPYPLLLVVLSSKDLSWLRVNLLLCFLSIFLSIFLSSGTQNVTHGDQKAAQGNKWCVAKPDATDEKLNDFIEYCRTEPKLKCVLSFFTPTGVCFMPNTTRDHANVCLNEYYKVLGPCQTLLGQILTTDPSHDKCIFQ